MVHLRKWLCFWKDPQVTTGEVKAESDPTPPVKKQPQQSTYTSCISVPKNMKKPYTMGVLSRLIASCCAQVPPCSLDVYSETNMRLLFHYDMTVDGVERINVRPPQADHACKLSFASTTHAVAGRRHTDFTWLSQFLSDAIADIHTHVIVSLRYTGDHGSDEPALNKIRNVLSGEIMEALAHDAADHPISKVELAIPSPSQSGAFNTFTVYNGRI